MQILMGEREAAGEGQGVRPGECELQVKVSAGDAGHGQGLAGFATPLLLLSHF